MLFIITMIYLHVMYFLSKNGNIFNYGFKMIVDRNNKIESMVTWLLGNLPGNCVIIENEEFQFIECMMPIKILNTYY